LNGVCQASDDQPVAALHMVVVDMGSPRSMLGWPGCRPTAAAVVG
jgi:hypothetical protein